MPKDFPMTLREFTKMVLRDQPKDINKYGAALFFCCEGRAAYEYFMQKLKEGHA